ncbi:TPA: hypothetical protein ACOEOO_001958 [Stenotrophomonas maltophilia]|uniref:hypothetical protein n=1 Tax=Stenotrophomonas maltophilia group TaxID=995085 RepID=UPI00155A6BFF|nr:MULTISPECIES: hypothetical protein [Stenotrophomonas maltophilia group]MDH2038307.1 hypothetical protein [Stenotrophomonas maltophilia]MDT3488670.1 hypothetical protein [Stenotrophomonas maltophilia group sp. msm4]
MKPFKDGVIWVIPVIWDEKQAPRTTRKLCQAGIFGVLIWVIWVKKAFHLSL